MDKVIIIDGVDVSECEHYRAEIETKMPYGEYEILKDKCHYSGIEIIQDCKGNKSCIYKQLQRAKAKLKKYEDIEQECEKYRLLYENADKSLAYWEEKCRRLETENERLKEENKELKEKFKQVFNIDNQECWNIAFLNDEKEKYRQALQEIRDMATLFHSVNENKGLDRFKNNILDKINEVIGAKNEVFNHK